MGGAKKGKAIIIINPAEPPLMMRDTVHCLTEGEPDVYKRQVHDLGSGAPVLLIHGSGPGVTAWANWRLVMPALAQSCRVIAPDMAGFGYTERLPGDVHTMEGWVAHAIGLLDALGLSLIHI